MDSILTRDDNEASLTTSNQTQHFVQCKQVGTTYGWIRMGIIFATKDEAKQEADRLRNIYIQFNEPMLWRIKTKVVTTTEEYEPFEGLQT